MYYEDPDTDDLVVQNGAPVMVSEIDEVAASAAQRIRTRLQTGLGEWFLNTGYGLDMQGVIWPKQVSRQVKDAHIQRQILLAAGAGAEITDYESTFDGQTRELSVAAKVKLNTGETVQVEV